jgi:hypothetical protein
MTDRRRSELQDHRRAMDAQRAVVDEHKRRERERAMAVHRAVLELLKRK